MIAIGDGGPKRDAAARRWLDKAASGKDREIAARAAKLRVRIDKNLFAANNSGIAAVMGIAAFKCKAWSIGTPPWLTMAAANGCSEKRNPSTMSSTGSRAPSTPASARNASGGILTAPGQPRRTGWTHERRTSSSATGDCRGLRFMPMTDASVYYFGRTRPAPVLQMWNTRGAGAVLQWVFMREPGGQPPEIYVHHWNAHGFNRNERLQGVQVQQQVKRMKGRHPLEPLPPRLPGRQEDNKLPNDKKSRSAKHGKK